MHLSISDPEILFDENTHTHNTLATNTAAIVFDGSRICRWDSFEIQAFALRDHLEYESRNFFTPLNLLSLICQNVLQNTFKSSIFEMPKCAQILLLPFLSYAWCPSNSNLAHSVETPTETTGLRILW